MHLEIITPDHVAFDGNIESVLLPTMDGEIVVLAHHAPLIAIIVPGTLVVRAEGKEHAFAVSRGVIEVDGQDVHVITDIADPADELEEAAIEKAKQDAEKLMQDKRQDEEGFAEAVAILDKELARLKTVRRRSARRSFTPPVK